MLLFRMGFLSTCMPRTRLRWITLVTAALLGARAPAPAAGAPAAAAWNADSLREHRADFEDRWNDLLAALLEARASASPDASTLEAAARRITLVEPDALGTTLAARALDRHAAEPVAAARAWARAWSDERRGWSGAVPPAAADSLMTVARDTYRSLGDTRREAVAAGRLGALAVTRQDWPRARTRLVDAVARRRALGDPLLVGNSLSDLGAAELNLGQDSSAIVALEEARAIRERIGDARLGKTLGYLAAAYSRAGRRDDADAAYHTVLALPANPAARLDLLLNYAEHLRLGGRPDAAWDTLAVADSLAGDTAPPDKRALLRERRSQVAADAGRFTDALALLDASVAAADADGDTLAAAHARSRRGALWLAGRATAEARADLEGARATATAFGDSALLGRTICDLALADQLDGDATHAHSLARRALAIADAAGDAGLAHAAEHRLGDLAFDARRDADAEHWYARAVSRDGDPRSVAALGDRLNLAAARARLGRLDDAERELADVAARADSAGLLRLAPEARADLAHIAWLRGDTLRALALGRENLDRVERLRAEQRGVDPLLGLFASHADEYDSAIAFLVRAAAAPGRAALGAEAFDCSERARARALLDRLAARGEVPAAPLPLAAVQRALAPGDALLEYALGDSLGVAWLVRRDTCVWRELPDRRRMRFRIETLRRQLADPAGADAPRARAMLDALGDTLVGRFEPWLRGVGRLIVVGDGPLCFVPFPCLRTRGRYLIERFTVVNAPSASVFARGAGAEPAPLVVALGDPAFPAGARASIVRSVRGPALVRLPATRDEVRALARLAPPLDVVTLEDRHATRQRLLAVPGLGRAEIIHLATHGHADDLDPAQSSLWFAPDAAGGPAGRLSARDIAGLDLHVSLVTLATCESGLGRFERGEGVLGFARAFLAAGTRSVVGSLWQVSDAGSATLMAWFYEALLVDRLPRAAALAAAQRRMLRVPAAQSPFYWGAFVLVGDDGPLTLPPQRTRANRRTSTSPPAVSRAK